MKKKVVELSRKKYGKKRAVMENGILKRHPKQTVENKERDFFD